MRRLWRFSPARITWQKKANFLLPLQLGTKNNYAGKVLSHYLTISRESPESSLIPEILHSLVDWLGTSDKPLCEVDQGCKCVIVYERALEEEVREKEEGLDASGVGCRSRKG